MKKTGALALLLVLLPVAREYAQENAGEAINIYQELTGEYEFYVPKAYVLARVFVDKGMLWTQDEDTPAAEKAIPVDLASLPFKIDDPKKEQYIRFLRDPNGRVSECLLTIKGGETKQEISGRKITRNERPIDARCSVQELREDFLKAREAMERLHPALYEFTDKETFERLYERQLGLIDKPLTVQEFYSVLAPVVAAIGCGHSRLLPPDRFWEEAPDSSFPLGLAFFEKKGYVTRLFEPSLPIPLGSEILTINGQSLSDFLRWVWPAISSDGLREPWKWEMLGKWFHIYAALRFRFPKSYVVTYLAPGKSEPLLAELKSIERKVILDIYSQAPLPAASADSNLSFEILKDKSTAVLTIGHFNYYQEEDLKRFKSFIDGAFVQIRSADVKHLILDLRGNNGGSPLAAAHLLSYLETKPVPYFTKEYGGGYEVLAKPVPRADLAFDGRLFTLIDGGCFSSTGHFCGLLKYHKTGVLAGTETGGTFECNDASHLVNLWNTRLKLYVARMTFSAAVQGMSKTTGVEPDYPVQPRIEDVINGRDAIKEYAFALIGKAEGEVETQTKTEMEESPRRVEIRDTEMRFLKSKHVDQTYEIDISLPKDYRQETARYPVLYVLDAEYNFGCVAYIVRRLIKNGDIPKVLVVGVAYNTTEDDFYRKRERDCTPPSEIHGSRVGGADNFIRFFEEELIPTIDHDYRTIPGNRTIVGHSIGGFFGAYVLFTHPDLFGKYLIVSPSLWYSKDVIFQYEREFAQRNNTLNAAVFLSTGKDESAQMIRTTEKMIRIIEDGKYKGLRFNYLMPEGEHHRSVFPYAFTKGVRWLFGAVR